MFVGSLEAVPLQGGAGYLPQRDKGLLGVLSPARARRDVGPFRVASFLLLDLEQVPSLSLVLSFPIGNWPSCFLSCPPSNSRPVAVLYIVYRSGLQKNVYLFEFIPCVKILLCRPTAMGVKL